MEDKKNFIIYLKKLSCIVEENQGDCLFYEIPENKVKEYCEETGIDLDDLHFEVEDQTITDYIAATPSCIIEEKCECCGEINNLIKTVCPECDEEIDVRINSNENATIICTYICPECEKGGNSNEINTRRNQ